MQLVAYGAQDIYLTGNPQITFFKVVYRRHTNFACEAIEQTINGSTCWGGKFSVTVARNGDLLSRTYLQLDDLAASTTAAAGTARQPQAFDIIEYVEVEIGGQCIDKHYGEWMEVWADLTENNKGGLNRMLQSNGTGDDSRVYVPFMFWFCRNPGLALPLIALQYHEVKFNVKLGKCGGGSINCGASVWCDYVFLDTDERRRFAQVSHEYLIEQVQRSNPQSMTSCNHEAKLLFNHPVKELVWVVRGTCDAQASGCARAHWGTSALGAGTATTSAVNTALTGVHGDQSLRCDSALLQLNGHDRFRERAGDYFTDVQRWQHHTGDRNTAVAGAPQHIHVYSFALKPEEHQPSGTCNFSRIDNAVLRLKLAAANGEQLRVYAHNYNVLRIMSGMGGLAYSN